MFSATTSFAGDMPQVNAPAEPPAEKRLLLEPLISEAFTANPELRAIEQSVRAARFRVPQASALPDPMVMFGYQNEGWERYTYGEMEDAMWMYSASQMFPFPGKRRLKGEMAEKDAEGLTAEYDDMKLRVEARVKEFYYELFLAYKELDIIGSRKTLFQQIEDAALARYTSGMGPQQEVIMAQTEKYMLKEKEEMLNQQIRSTEAMLNSTLGRDIGAPLGRPEDVSPGKDMRGMEGFLAGYSASSPRIKSRERMMEAAEARVKMAKKEYYPDFTLKGSVFTRKGEFDDMWSLTTELNIPLYYRKKQRQAVNEAEASFLQAKNELEAEKLMIASGIRDNYAMIRASENLLGLYREGIIPKIAQDFESALAGYHTGKVEAITVINRLKALLDTESLYWKQVVEQRKALARLKGLTGIPETETGQSPAKGK